MVMRALLDHLPLLGLLLAAAVIDVRQRRIPNWLTLGLILSGLARAAALSGWAGLAHAVAGVFAGAAVPFILFALGALGGGDVKLLAGIGAWLGPAPALAVFALQCVIGLGLVLAQALHQGRTLVLFRNTAVLAADIARQGVVACAPGGDGQSFRSIDRPLPYAVPVAIATIAVVIAPAWNVF
jgi:prepilin peptidase CpaA